MQEESNKEQLDPKELAALLRKPEGEKGIKVAEMLSNTNIHITNFTYNSMDIKDGDTILEIGFGNGKLMPQLLKKGNSIRLIGVDFAKEMVEQGNQILENYIQNGQIELLQASVESLPFEDHYFDAICTINTLYFWPDAVNCCKEVKRVLKPGGQIHVGIRPKEEAEKLPATQYGFTLYDHSEAIQLLENVGFQDVEIIEQGDPPIEFNGEIKSFRSWVVKGRK